MKILLVEDDPLIVRILTEILAQQNYVVDVAIDGESGWELAGSGHYDLIILDVMLPKVDGISLCQRLRRDRNAVPILLLTAKTSKNDKILGLDAGADDYVVKPFDGAELLARIRVLLRRGNSALPPILEWNNLRLDPNSCEVMYFENLLPLTPTEYRLVELFLRNPRRVFSRDSILNHLWPFEETPNANTINSHIKALRQKFKRAGAPEDLIETIYGLGYRLKERFTQNLSGQRDHPVTEPENVLEKSVKNPEQTNTAMTAVWQQFQPQIVQRTGNLKANAIALQQGPENSKLRQKIQQEAHKLAGSLGIFGFNQGSELAKQIEEILLTNLPLNQPEMNQILQAIAQLEVVVATTPIQPSTQPSFVNKRDRAVVLMIDDDIELAKWIAIEAATWGIRLEIATDLDDARQRIIAHPPDAILLDLSFSDTAEDGFSLLQELSNRTQLIPAIIFTARDSLRDRVTVARLGASAFLQKPVPADQVLATVTEILNHPRTENHQPLVANNAKVIIVDTEVQVQAQIRKILAPWEMKIFTLSNPKKFWEVLETVTPDLLIFAIELPDLSGIDLCQVVRNEPRWKDLPILFLAKNPDIETVQKIFNAGGDDYLNKPIIETEFVNRVINHLERSHLHRR